MEKTKPGLKKTLTPDWRGGPFCRVISGGEIAVGDSVELIPQRQSVAQLIIRG